MGWKGGGGVKGVGTYFFSFVCRTEGEGGGGMNSPDPTINIELMKQP